MIIAAQLSFRAEPRSGEVEESHSSRQRVVILSARLCENSDFNAIPEKPSLIHRAGATISIGGMILVSPFSPSVRVFTQSRAAKNPRRPDRVSLSWDDEDPSPDGSG